MGWDSLLLVACLHSEFRIAGVHVIAFCAFDREHVVVCDAPTSLRTLHFPSCLFFTLLIMAIAERCVVVIGGRDHSILSNGLL